MAIAGVLLALLGLDLLFAFLAEMDALSPTYHLHDALIQVVLHVPSNVYEMIPVACLIGVLIGLGLLANNSELTVMRAAGLSPLRIVFYTLLPALTFALLCLLLAQWVVPYSERTAQVRKLQVMGSVEDIQGYWHREGDNFVHVGAVQSHDILRGVDFYAYSQQGLLQQTGSARTAVFAGDHWQLQDWHYSLINASSQVQAGQVSSLRWDTALTPDFLKVATLDPEYQSLSGLYAYATYLAHEGLDAGPYYLEFWKKVMQPLATLVMVLLAASILFGPLRSVTMGLRLVTGVFLGLGFRYGQDFFGFASLIYHFSPFWGAAFPALLALLAGLSAMVRVR